MICVYIYTRLHTYIFKHIIGNIDGYLIHWYAHPWHIWMRSCWELVDGIRTWYLSILAERRQSWQSWWGNGMTSLLWSKNWASIHKAGPRRAKHQRGPWHHSKLHIILMMFSAMMDTTVDRFDTTSELVPHGFYRRWRQVESFLALHILDQFFLAFPMDVLRKFVADFWSFPHSSAWCYIMLHGFCFPWPGKVAVGPCYRFDSRTTFRQWNLESESYPQQVLQWYTQGGSDFTLIQSRSVFHEEIGLEDAIGCLRTWFVPRATTGRKLCRSCRLFPAWTWQTTSSVPRTPAASALQRLMGKWSRQVYLGMKLVDLPTCHLKSFEHIRILFDSMLRVGYDLPGIFRCILLSQTGTGCFEAQARIWPVLPAENDMLIKSSWHESSLFKLAKSTASTL